MPKYDFTMTETAENKVYVTVEAETEDEAREKAEAGDFITSEHQEVMSIRGYKIDTFDGVQHEE